MRRVFYKKRNDPQKRIKNIAICSKTEDKQCRTRVYKSFSYHVSPVIGEKLPFSSPSVFIKKSFNTARGVEKFSFEVKGSFYTQHGQFLAQVNFYHRLHIRIAWKYKIFSPNKSAVLT